MRSRAEGTRLKFGRQQRGGIITPVFASQITRSLSISHHWISIAPLCDPYRTFRVISSSFLPLFSACSACAGLFAISSGAAQFVLGVWCIRPRLGSHREPSYLGMGPNWSANMATLYFIFPRLPPVGSPPSAGCTSISRGSFFSLDQAKHQACRNRRFFRMPRLLSRTEKFTCLQTKLGSNQGPITVL